MSFLIALRSSSFTSLAQLEDAIPKIMANHIELGPLRGASAKARLRCLLITTTNIGPRDGQKSG